jgi:xylitol oxidase
VTLDIQPTFMRRQWFTKTCPLGELPRHFAEIEASGYSVSLFTDCGIKT